MLEQHEAVEEAEVEAEDNDKVIPVNKPITLSGDSIWDEDSGKNPESVNVESVTVSQSTDEGGDYAHISVKHDGPWTVYTDSGFEEAISEIVGFNVSIYRTRYARRRRSKFRRKH